MNCVLDQSELTGVDGPPVGCVNDLYWELNDKQRNSEIQIVREGGNGWSKEWREEKRRKERRYTLMERK